MIEALPVEIIEKIFLNSLNLNFPRASRILGAALSREHIYRLLIILAFWDDSPMDNPNSEAIYRLLAPLEYVPITYDERIVLQEQIFRCRWLNMKRVQEQLPTITILTIHRQWINAGIKMEPNEQAKLDRFMARKDNTLRKTTGKGPPLRRLINDPSLQRLVKSPGPQEYELVLLPNVLVAVVPCNLQLTIARPTLQLPAFPPHLLRGRSTGFTEEDVQFLEMLRICSYNYKPEDTPIVPSASTTVDRTAINEGIANAIRTQNMDALTTLLKIDEYIFRFLRRKNWPNLYTIPEEHFISVTKTGCDNPARNIAFMQALVRASAESLPHDSTEIAEWSFEMAKAVNADQSMYEGTEGNFIRWLLDFDLRNPAHSDLVAAGQVPQLFSCGEVDRLGLEGMAYLEAMRPEPHTVNNYMPESSFKPDEVWLKKFGQELPLHMLR